MNILYAQYVYPILNCICGVGVIYLYSCSQNNNNNNISKLKVTIDSLTEEVLDLNKLLSTNENKYIKSLEELEQFYETKIIDLESKICKIDNQEDHSFTNFIK